MTMDYSHIVTIEQFKAFLKDVESADYWNDFETEEWESACEFAGLHYNTYEDPDTLFDDLQNFAKCYDSQEEFTSPHRFGYYSLHFENEETNEALDLGFHGYNLEDKCTDEWDATVKAAEELKSHAIEDGLRAEIEEAKDHSYAYLRIWDDSSKKDDLDYEQRNRTIRIWAEEVDVSSFQY